MDNETLIKTYWADACRVISVEARRWRVPWEDHEDIIQTTFLDLTRYPMSAESARDPLPYFMACVRQRAKRSLWDYRGFAHKKGTKTTDRSKVEQSTSTVGLYQSQLTEDDSPMDERILPPMPSAESVYLATLPSKAQEDLRGAIGGLAPRQREALTLRFYEELSVPDVALKMGLSYDQTSRAISEGLRTLRTRLNPGQRSYPKGVVTNGKRKIDA